MSCLMEPGLTPCTRRTHLCKMSIHHFGGQFLCVHFDSQNGGHRMGTGRCMPNGARGQYNENSCVCLVFFLKAGCRSQPQSWLSLLEAQDTPDPATAWTRQVLLSQALILAGETLHWSYGKFYILCLNFHINSRVLKIRAE